jgi:hypothetical protein
MVLILYTMGRNVVELLRNSMLSSHIIKHRYSFWPSRNMGGSSNARDFNKILEKLFFKPTAKSPSNNNLES